MLTKLLKMGLGEVADRSRQKASRWFERNALRTPQSRRRTRRLATDDHEFAARQSLDYFKATGSDRFFAGVADPQVKELFTGLLPAASASVLAAAESIRSGRFDLLGFKGLTFGNPVDWRLDPISGRTSPLLHWTSIDALDSAVVGDSKVVWELNRMQFLVTLGLAYRASGDEANAFTFANLARSWIRENPAGLGINWVSSLEAAFRVVSWSWALSLFKSSPHLTPGLFWEITEAIETHAAHIERYLSRHSSPNTHLTGEALGLFYAGTLFPENPLAARWRSLGQRILDEQIQHQVLPDGVYFEQTTAYQLYTIEIYLHYLILASRNNVPVPVEIAASVQRMLDVILALRRPDGGVPTIGDQDGGTLLPLVRREPDDARGVFAVAAAFFGRPDFAWAAESVQPEALWLLGSAAIARFEATGAAPPLEASRAFEGGYVVMRSGWQRTAHHLVFDVGPLGCPITGAHGHADLLSVVVSPFGEPFIVDPGTSVYAADPAFRQYFRGTEAHSTVTVDGLGQAEPAGPFGWQKRPEAHLSRFESSAGFDFADASHDAYKRLADPVTHRRRVVFVKSRGYWVIVDDLAGSAEHTFEQRFQFAALPVGRTPDGWVRARGSRGRGLLIRTFADVAVETRIESGSLQPIAGWISANYGQRVPSPMLVFTTPPRASVRMLTLLFPVEDAGADPPRVRIIDGEGRAPVGLRFEDAKEVLRFDDDAFAFEGNPPWKA